MAYTMKKTDAAGRTYYLAAWRQKDLTGKTKIKTEKYKGPDGKRGAQKLATLREAEAANQSPERNTDMKFAGFALSVWYKRNTRGNSDSTKYAKKRIVEDLIGIIGDKKLSEVKQAEFENVMDHLTDERGLAQSTVRNYMKVLKRIMVDAARWDYAPKGHTPWENVEPIKEKKGRPVTVSREDGLRAADYLRAAGDNYTADLVTILTYTGLRLSEALGLHWEDIDLDRGVMKIWRITVRTNNKKKRIQIQERTKTAAGERYIPITKAVREVLERRQRSTNHYLVFPDHKGQPKYSSAATRPITLAFQKLGIRGSAHKLRHGAITRMIEQGMPLNLVSKQAGHESPDITAKIYLGVLDDQVAIDAMLDAMED